MVHSELKLVDLMSELGGPAQSISPEQGTHLGKVAPLSWWCFFLWAIGRLKRFRVSGPSMHPTLLDGVEVLIDSRASAQSSVCVGDLVFIQHPFRRDLRMIKRVVRMLEGTGAYFVQGDNVEESTDSRSFGAVNHHYVLGRVVCTFP